MPDSAYSFDAEFDALPFAIAKRVALRAAAEHADKLGVERLGVVIGGSLSEGLAVD
jgi:hypothetical protein